LSRSAVSTASSSTATGVRRETCVGGLASAGSGAAVAALAVLTDVAARGAEGGAADAGRWRGRPGLRLAAAVGAAVLVAVRLVPRAEGRVAERDAGRLPDASPVASFAACVEAGAGARGALLGWARDGVAFGAGALRADRRRTTALALRVLRRFGVGRDMDAGALAGISICAGTAPSGSAAPVKGFTMYSRTTPPGPAFRSALALIFDQQQAWPVGP
jgi:hypothetical protein